MKQFEKQTFLANANKLSSFYNNSAYVWVKINIYFLLQYVLHDMNGMN